MAQRHESAPAAAQEAPVRSLGGWPAGGALTSGSLDIVARLGLIGVVGLLFALPTLLLVWAGVSPLPVVTESLAYRYFISLRMLEGESGLIFTYQGQTPGLIHHALVWLLGVVGIPLADLRPRLDLFTYLFLLVNAAGTVVVLALAAFSRTFRWTDRLAVAIVPVWATYSSQGALSLAIRPDYYTVEVTFTTAAVYVFLRQLRAGPEAYASRQIVALGVFAGLMAATKIALFWTGLLAAVPTLMPAVPPLMTVAGLMRLLVRGATFVLIAIGTFLLVTLAYYRFDVALLPEFLVRWVAFVSNPGGEDLFWVSVFFPGSPGSNLSADYGYARLMLPLWGVVVLGSLIFGIRSRRGGHLRWVVPLAVLALGGWQVLGLVVRPAGTTLYEMGLFVVASGGIALASMSAKPWRVRATGVWIGVLTVYCLFSGLVNGPIIFPLAAFQASSTTVWEAHAWLRQQGQPVIAFIPDNRHTAGTVEEALLKGMSDQPTWNINQGRALLEQLAPGLSFQQTFTEAPAGVTVFWIEIVGEPQLTDQHPALGAFASMAALADPSGCHTWQIATYPWYRRTLHACRSGPSGP